MTRGAAGARVATLRASSCHDRARRAPGAVGFHAGLIWLALATAPVAALAANDPAGTPSPGRSAEAAQATAVPGPSLSVAEILTATEAIEVSEQRIQRRLAAGMQIDALAVEIEAVERDFPKADRFLADASVDMLQFYDLLDLATAARGSDRRLTAATEALAARAKALDADLDQLARHDAQSAAWLEAARARNAPTAVLERVEAIPRRSDALARQLRAARDQVLQVLDRATRLRR